MNIVRFFMEDKRRFHIGDSSGDIKDIFSSGQLFSAVINSARLLYGKSAAEAMIVRFLSGDVLFSSMFLGLRVTDEKNEKTIHLLPKPTAPIIDTGAIKKEIINRKKKKKIKLLSGQLLQKLGNYWKEDAGQFECDLLESTLLIGNSIGVDPAELSGFNIDQERLESLQFLKTDSKPHNVISRRTGASDNIFYIDSLILEKKETDNVCFEPFMYFIVEGDFTKELKASIRLMADEGIGGKRSIGMGYFDSIEFEEGADSKTERDAYCLSLSTLLPEKGELDQLISYELEKASGFVHSGRGLSIRKKGYRLLSEGAITKGKLKGQVVDVTPEHFNQHPVYLNGKGVQIGFGDII